jgi:hypothetical protein
MKKPSKSRNNQTTISTSNCGKGARLGARMGLARGLVRAPECWLGGLDEKGRLSMPELAVAFIVLVFLAELAVAAGYVAWLAGVLL